jgi:hypothetical protein
MIRLRTLVVVAGCAAVLGAAPLGHAAGTSTGRWAQVASPNPSPGKFGDSLDGLDCPTTHACFAVGSVANSATLLAHLSHGEWKAQSGATHKSYARLAAVSCATATACVAVGDDFNSAIAERYNGRHWTTVSLPKSPKDASLSGVSCPTSKSCWAVGQSTTTSNYAPYILRFRRGHWSEVGAVVPKHGGVLSSVSCRGQQCWAVGTTFARHDGSNPLAERWDGKRWTRVDVPVVGKSEASLSGVACPSTRRCYAVGNVYNTGTIFGPPFIEKYNGHAWSLAFQSKPSLATQMGGISCSSSSACSAVGTKATRTGDGRAFILTRSRGDWVNPPVTQPAHSPSLSAVSCPSATECFAVGSHNKTKTSGVLKTLILRRH